MADKVRELILQNTTWGPTHYGVNSNPNIAEVKRLTQGWMEQIGKGMAETGNALNEYGKGVWSSISSALTRAGSADVDTGVAQNEAYKNRQAIAPSTETSPPMAVSHKRGVYAVPEKKPQPTVATGERPSEQLSSPAVARWQTPVPAGAFNIQTTGGIGQYSTADEEAIKHHFVFEPPSDKVPIGAGVMGTAYARYNPQKGVFEVSQKVAEPGAPGTTGAWAKEWSEEQSQRGARPKSYWTPEEEKEITRINEVLARHEAARPGTSERLTPEMVNAYKGRLNALTQAATSRQASETHAEAQREQNKLLADKIAMEYGIHLKDLEYKMKDLGIKEKQVDAIKNPAALKMFLDLLPVQEKIDPVTGEKIKSVMATDEDYVWAAQQAQNFLQGKPIQARPKPQLSRPASWAAGMAVMQKYFPNLTRAEQEAALAKQFPDLKKE